MACGVSGIVLATWGALTSSANCNSAKARRTTRTCCTPPFRRLRNSCWSFLVTSILRGGRPIPRVCAKTILHKNGFYELFQVVKNLAARPKFDQGRGMGQQPEESRTCSVEQ